jgi:anti-anti-sigma factor
MPLLLEHRRVGHTAVVACAGHLVEGAELMAFERTLDELLQFGPYLILHLGGVEFVDNAGLGLLVRYSARIRNAQGSLKLCAVSSKLAAVLRATRLEQIFNVYESESEAIAAFVVFRCRWVPHRRRHPLCRQLR